MTPGALPSPWANRDIGNVSQAGRALFNNGAFQINASGDDIGAATDGFHFVYQPLNGDGEITLRVASFQNASPGAKAGVMIRESLASNARQITLGLTPEWGFELWARQATGTNGVFSGGSGGRAPFWARLVREGNVFKTYASADGVTWSLVSAVTIGMDSQTYIGLAVTNRNNNALCEALIDNISLRGGVPAPGRPPAPSVATGMTSNAHTNATALATTAGATTTQVSALAAQIEQAYAAFLLEYNQLTSPDQIELAMRSALYFTRAAGALADAQAPSTAVQNRLQIAASRLAQARNIMTNTSNSSSSGDNAHSAISSAMPPVIGAAETRSSASFTPVVAPQGLATVTGDANMSPLAMQEGSAAQNAALPYELGGTSVSIGGRAAQVLSVSPARLGFLVPSGLPAGEAEVIVTSESGYVSRGTITVAALAPGIFTTSGNGTGEAVVMNAATYTRGQFDVTTEANLSPDKRTRLMLFATGFSAGAANTNANNDVRLDNTTLLANLAESVAVEARLSDGRTYQLALEYAGWQGRFAGLDQLVVVLPSELRGAGSVQLTIIVAGQRSNSATISVR